MLTQDKKKRLKIRTPSSQGGLKADLNNNEEVKWLLAYMKWFLYANDLDKISNN